MSDISPDSIGRPDTFVIVNGPEDGAAFPISQNRFDIGQDPDCYVTLRLDASVQPRHAEISAVSEGYRFRSVGRAPVFVRDKKAGLLRSRVARHGDTVRIGHTLMCIDCSPDGLAKRSRGLPLESDTVYLAKAFFYEIGRGTLAFLRFFFGSLRRLLGSWLGVTSVLVLLYFFWYPLHWRVNYYATQFAGFVASFIRSLFA